MYKPLPNYLTIRKSSIHGLGLFAKSYIPKDHCLGESLYKSDISPDGYIRTPLGGFINHSVTPNCRVETIGNVTRIYTRREINPNEELTLKYNLYDPSKRQDI